MIDASVLQDVFILGMCAGAACYLVLSLALRCFNWLANRALDRLMERRGMPAWRLEC